jgi:hypothetical protein
MRLWMLTKPDFPDIARRHERLFASWEMIDDLAWYERPYRWMIAQMAERGIDTEGHPPFWAWHSYGSRGKRVDLRTHYPFEPMLRLSLDVPDALALLSDEADWHAVLNNWCLSASEVEYEHFEKLEDAGKLSQAEKETTWQRIFDLTQYGDPEWNGLAGEKYIQACLPWFEHRWIKKVEHFKGRPRKKK